jgi:hypothetical protein
MDYYLKRFVDKQMSFDTFIREYLRTQLKSGEEGWNKIGLTGSQYYLNKKQEAVDKLAKFDKMSSKQKLAHGHKVKRQYLLHAKKDLQRCKKEVKKLSGLLVKLLRWQPAALLLETKERLIKAVSYAVQTGTFDAEEYFRKCDMKSDLAYYMQVFENTKRSVAFFDAQYRQSLEYEAYDKKLKQAIAESGL